MTLGKKFYSVFVATFLTLLMVFGSFFVIESNTFTTITSAEEEDEETKHNHNTEGWIIFDAGSYSSGEITGEEDEDSPLKLYLNGNIELSEYGYDLTITSGYVVLCLNGKVLTGTGYSSVITVSEGANFTLCDCQENEEGVENDIENLEGGYDTYTSGVITGGKGTRISSSTYGGGVYVYFGTFTMESGTISNNEATYAGGGVYVGGSTASFTMTGGTISNNTSGYFGGGVYVNGGSTFTMTGGTISNNEATIYYGGGVYILSGAFIMESGTISNNEASSGGGVSVSTSSASFTMKSGTIEYNTANANGGAVYVYGTFTMKGGTISNNTANTNGGAVYVYDRSSATFTMSGGFLDRTIYKNSSGTITISGGYFGEEAYNNSSSPLEDWFEDGYTIVTLSDDNRYGDKDYVSEFPYAVYILDTLTLTDVQIEIDTVACDEATTYSPTITGASADAVITYTYKGITYEGTEISGSGLPTDAGTYTVTATVWEIIGSTRTVNQQIIEFEVEIEHEFGDWQSDGDEGHYKVCKNCEVTTETEEHTGNSGYVEGDGGHYKVCEECKAQYGEVIAHTSDKVTYTNSTQHYLKCSECYAYYDYANHTGNVEYAIYTDGHYETCEDCGTEYNYAEHTGDTEYVEGDGGHYKVCEECKAQYDYKEHTLVWDYDEDEHWQVCKVCEAKTETEGHSWSEWTVTNKPTSTEDGEQERICEVCGESETEIVSATGKTNMGIYAIIVCVILLLCVVVGLLVLFIIKKKKVKTSKD